MAWAVILRRWPLNFWVKTSCCGTLPGFGLARKLPAGKSSASGSCGDPPHAGRPGTSGKRGSGLAPRRHAHRELDQLRERIELEGHALTAEEPSTCAMLPAMDSKGLRPRPYVLRAFRCEDWRRVQALAGGAGADWQGRIPGSLSVRNGAAHDVWVTASGESPSQLSLLRPALEAAIVQRRSKGIPSRVADNLFWLGRYCERADWTMRLMRGALHRLEDAGPAQDPAPARRAIELLLCKDEGLAQILTGDEAPAALEQLVSALMSSPGRAYGLRSTLDNVHRVSSLIRDRLSVELWRTLQAFHENGVWRGEKRPRDGADCLTTSIRALRRSPPSTAWPRRT